MLEKSTTDGGVCLRQRGKGPRAERSFHLLALLLGTPALGQRLGPLCSRSRFDEKFDDRDIEHSSQPIKHIDCGVTFLAFNLADIRTVHASIGGEALL